MLLMLSSAAMLDGAAQARYATARSPPAVITLTTRLLHTFLVTLFFRLSFTL